MLRIRRLFFAFDVRLGFFDSQLPCNASVISLSASIVAPKTTRKDAARPSNQKKYIER
jgi:hypothetical protein